MKPCVRHEFREKVVNDVSSHLRTSVTQQQYALLTKNPKRVKQLSGKAFK